MHLSAFILTALLADGALKTLPPRPWAAPLVTLVDAGAKERQPLRYRLKRGAGAAELTGAGSWYITVAAGRSGGPLPSISTPFEVTVESPTLWSFSFQAASATGEGLTQDPVTPLIMKAIEGVHGQVTVDDRGLASKLAIFPSSSDSQHRDDVNKIEMASYYAMQMARTAFMHHVVPFPGEPVGLGAVWKVERPQTRGMISYLEVATYTLKARTAEQVTLGVALSGKEDPASPVRPGELTLHVAGDGELVVDLAAPLPARLDEKLVISAVVGPKHERRTEHEGSMSNQFRYRGR